MSTRARAAESSELDEPQLGDVLEFMRLMWALDHALQRTSKRMQARLGITGPQRLAIRVLARFPGLTAGRLARLLHVHPSTLTGIVRRLERQGLVERRVDARDRRRALLGLTRAGRRFDIDSAGTVELAVRTALAELPDEAVRHAADVLVRIRSELELPMSAQDTRGPRAKS